MRPVNRAAGTLPLVGAVLAASALTGAAFFSVSEAGCQAPGHYVDAGHHIALVGGCVSGDELPARAPAVTAHTGGNAARP